MPLLNWTDGTTGTTATPTWWTTTTSTTSSTVTYVDVTMSGTSWTRWEPSVTPAQRRRALAYLSSLTNVEAANDQQSRADLELQRELWLQAQNDRMAVAVEADAKATALLLANLNEQQRRTYKENGWFTVEGGVTRERYRLRSRQGLAGNIDVMHGTRVAHRLCAHGPSDIPMADQLLAQKLHLELDEESFLRVANRHPARAF